MLLWEHEARILSGELKELAPFLALLQEQPDPAIIDKQKELLEGVTDPKLQSALFAIAMVIPARSFGYKVVLEKFKKEVNMLKETSIVQEWLDESYKAGEMEAESKGEIKGKRALLQTFMQQKFGNISPEVLLKLQLSGNEQLDRLAAIILNLNSLDELQAYLSNGASAHGVN